MECWEEGETPDGRTVGHPCLCALGMGHLARWIRNDTEQGLGLPACFRWTQSCKSALQMSGTQKDSECKAQARCHTWADRKADLWLDEQQRGSWSHASHASQESESRTIHNPVLLSSHSPFLFFWFPICFIFLSEVSLICSVVPISAVPQVTQFSTSMLSFSKYSFHLWFIPGDWIHFPVLR